MMKQFKSIKPVRKTLLVIFVFASFFSIQASTKDSTVRAMRASGFEINNNQYRYKLPNSTTFFDLHYYKEMPDFGHSFNPDIDNGIREYTLDSDRNSTLVYNRKAKSNTIKEDYLQFYYYHKFGLFSTRKLELSMNGGLSYSFCSSYLGKLIEDRYYYQNRLDTAFFVEFYHQQKRIGFHICPEFTYKMNPKLHPPTKLTTGINFGIYYPISDITILEYTTAGENTYPYPIRVWHESPLPRPPRLYYHSYPYGTYSDLRFLHRKSKPLTDVNVHLKLEILITKKSIFYLQAGFNMFVNYNTGASTKNISCGFFGLGYSRKMF